jgi:hypothetical protein
MITDYRARARAAVGGDRSDHRRESASRSGSIARIPQRDGRARVGDMLVVKERLAGEGIRKALIV